jgi:hypothetical protein
MYFSSRRLQKKISNHIRTFKHPSDYFQTNNVDDNGLVEGKWDGSFEDGTSPFAWIGSTPIFEEFYNTQMPVKYGQCWVFSGVIVTSECYTWSRLIFATTI